MIKSLPTTEPKSPDSFIDLIRLLLDLAFNNRLNYLSITYRVAGDAEVSSVSLSVDGS